MFSQPNFALVSSKDAPDKYVNDSGSVFEHLKSNFETVIEMSVFGRLFYFSLSVARRFTLTSLVVDTQEIGDQFFRLINIAHRATALHAKKCVQYCTTLFQTLSHIHLSNEVNYVSVRSFV